MSDDDARYQITAEGLKVLEAELHELETAGRQEIAERIKVARDFGDLKENSEYHDAKNDQAHLETKILHLRDRANNAIVVEPAAGSARIALGSKVTVADENGGSETHYELVSATEADLKQGRLSFDSPLARALTGSAAGDVVQFQTPRGPRRLRIVTVS
jgi:transcription elongation factor GreA